MKFKILLVIPSRFNSTRLPGKPLKKIGGKTLIQRVFIQATKSKAKKVIIATDSKDILEHALSFGANAILTDSNHVSGTDRVYEASLSLEIPDNEIIVNVYIIVNHE